MPLTVSITWTPVSAPWLEGGFYYPPAFTPQSQAIIRTHVRKKDRIEATDEDAAAFSVNAVKIRRHVIMATPPDSLRERLAALGYSVTAIDLAPFILSGGGAYCMTLRLDRRSGENAAMRAAE